MCWVAMVQLSNEMVTLSHLLLCNIYSFDATFAFSWSFMANPDAIDPAFPTLLKENPCIEMEIILRLLPLSWKQTNNACKIPKQHHVYLVSALCAEPITGG